MTARLLQRSANEAKWSVRIGLFSAQLLVLAVVLHRFTSIGTPTAMNIMLIALLGAGFAGLLALIALIRIWRRGHLGAGQAVGGLFIAILALALPLYFLPNLLLLPHITDVSTDTGSPPDFGVLTSTRPADANVIAAPTDEAVEQQQAAYPDIRPMELERPARAVHDIVTQAIDRLGWKVAEARRPDKSGVGMIEATDRTMIMGFTDDIAVRVTGDDAHAKIDVRSASRYGLHDFGTNAARIRALFTEVQAELAKGETTGLEQVAAAKADDEKDVKGPSAKKRKKRSAGEGGRRSSQYRARSNAQGARKQRARPRSEGPYQDQNRSWSPFFQ